MRRVLITGMSATGKSSLVAALAARGHRAVDLDDPAYSELVAVPDGELTGPGGGTDWVWREARVDALLAAEEPGVLFVGGCAPNQGAFYDRFDHVVLLSAPADVIAERLATRTTNDFGKDPGELARTLLLKEEVEPLLRRGADLEVDTTAPLDEVAAAVLRLVGRVAVVVPGSTVARTRERLVRAAERVARDGDVVVLSGLDEAEHMRSLWRGPRVELVVESEATSTAENAARTLPLLLERGVRDALVVCAPAHLARARWIFRRIYGGAGIAVRFRAARVWPTPGALAWEVAAAAVARRQVRSQLRR